MEQILLAATSVSFLLLIKAEYLKQKYQKYFFKPLTTILILVLALTTGGFVFNNYKLLIIAGIIFSLFGDIFLMFPETKFIHGLISFLIAHIFYIIGFSIAGNGILSLAYLLPFIVYGFTYYFYLYPSLKDKLKIPVLFYMLFIMAMGFSALNLWLTNGEKDFSQAFYGSVLFMISDSLLAYNKFKKSLLIAQFFILLTYFIAQVLIVMSIKSVY